MSIDECITLSYRLPLLLAEGAGNNYFCGGGAKVTLRAGTGRYPRVRYPPGGPGKISFSMRSLIRNTLGNPLSKNGNHGGLTQRGFRNHEVEYESQRVQRQRNIVAIDVRNVRMPCLFLQEKGTCDAFMYFSFFWEYYLGGLDSFCEGLD